MPGELRSSTSLKNSPSRIANVILPVLPLMSPPAGATLFPDEVKFPASPSSPPTAALHEIQPRRIYSPLRRTYFPRLAVVAPEWVALDNYRPALAPLRLPDISMPLETEYASRLPSIPPIPPAKRHKRKETDSFRLQVAYSLNPVSVALAKSSKCVLTGDWRVAQQEIRHVRAMERIETKKNDGRWSLRQPKKLRGPAIPKAHWDFLLDEMVSTVIDHD